MKGDSIKVFLLAIVLVIGMLACGGEAPKHERGEGKLEKMKPKSGDRLSKLMDRSWENLEYIMYGFINYDKEKIKTAVTNLDAISPYVAQKISPAHREHLVEWKEQANRQQEIVGNLKQQFVDEEFDEARKSLDELIENCMDCHKVYRKHLLKPKGEEAGH